MIEPKTNIGLSQHIEVSSNRIPDTISRLSGLPVKSPPKPHEVTRLFKEVFELDKREMLSRQVEATPSLAHGIDLARTLVNSWRNRFNLSSDYSTEPQVILLDRDSFQRHYRGSSKTMPAGFTIAEQGIVVIRHDLNKPEYLTASTACHEFGHAMLDRYVRVFSTVENRDARTRQQYRHRIFRELRRIGLAVAPTRQGITGNGWIVSVLNELPNYLLQKSYIDKILADSPQEFLGEISSRQQHLVEYLRGFDIREDADYIVIALRDEDQTERNIILHKSNLHFDKNGNPLFIGEEYSLGYYMMQLGSDLAEICQNINGRSFEEVILEAKINPILEVAVRNTVDAKMGEGFYDRLRSANCDKGDIVPLLEEVQAKLYKIVQNKVPN